ncbi:hypothetical protein NC652_039307 [Populus alba x Populus x berolinensis]|nr:hypothetical protein NC652_039307 [Populus alba x Populus x berolinensis]
MLVGGSSVTTEAILPTAPCHVENLHVPRIGRYCNLNFFKNLALCCGGLNIPALRSSADFPPSKARTICFIQNKFLTFWKHHVMDRQELQNSHLPELG